MKMSFKQTTNQISPRLSAIRKELKPLPKKTYNFFVQKTPIDTGFARRSTKFENTQTGGRIAGNYDYVNRLNEGHSRQSPNGMTKPSINYLRQNIRKILG